MKRHHTEALIGTGLGICLMLLALALFEEPTIDPCYSDEQIEELVQECIDIHTMEGNMNIAACLDLRHELRRSR